ncbi:MAG TPA: 2-isopropylmalate synthase [Polyangiaceae bacterium]|nr:2-isopropylmalate synthase [Polyangiaceae bacterium]
MSFNRKRYQAPDRVHLPDRTWPDRALTSAPTWCSVDLRDGNQALPDPMGHARKRALLELLIKVGFKQIELGFPGASQTDFDFIRWALTSGALPADVVPQVITQAREALISRTFESLAGAERAIVHLYNSTSELQRRVVFGKSRREILELAVQGTLWVKREAAKMPETRIIFQYSPESFTGTELEYALEVCDAVVEAWDAGPERPMILNLPTTVETTTPNVFADRIEWFERRRKRREHVTLSVHTHNDRGTGVASAELAMLAGATRVEGTLLGNGERSGNVDIVTLAMNLYSHGVDPQLCFADLPEVVRVVEASTRLPVHPRHPYAGELVFTAFSGSHQDAIHKGMRHMEQSDGSRYEVPYLPIDPADVGRAYEPVIRINSQSGKSGVAHVLERDHGYRVPRALAIELSQAVQQVADQRGEELGPGEIGALFERHYLDAAGPCVLESAGIERHPDGNECAVVARIAVAGRPQEVRGSGNGPVEAFVAALSTLGGSAFELVDYTEHAAGAGAGASAVAYVALRSDGIERYGVGRHDDVALAALRAVVSACNRMSLAIATARIAAADKPSPTARLMG